MSAEIEEATGLKAVLVGGGGGIAMMAGLCRIYAPLPFFITAAIAVAPVPLFFLLMGR